MLPLLMLQPLRLGAVLGASGGSWIVRDDPSSMVPPLSSAAARRRASLPAAVSAASPAGLA
jgi:hypothetical protein